MTTAPLGRIERLDPREIWKSEPYDFTPWLREPTLDWSPAPASLRARAPRRTLPRSARQEDSMLGLSDARRFRRLVAGFALIFAPAVLLVGALVHPQGDEDAAAHLAIVRGNPDRYYAAHAILLVGLALLLPAILGLVHLLKERWTAYGHVGGGLAMIGILGATAVVAVDGIAVSQMGQGDANGTEMAALLDRIKDSAGLRAIAVVGAVSFLLGVLVLALGLWRAGVAEPWIAGGMSVAAAAVFVAQVTDNRLIFAGAFALYVVSLAPLGWRILTESDAQWAGQPTGASPSVTTSAR